MNTLWLKTLRDLWLYKSRTILVVLAIAVGTAAVGVATTSFLVLRGDLRDGYQGTNPAHAILDVTPIDETYGESLADLPEVAAAEVRRYTVGRLVLDGHEKRVLQLWTLPDTPAIGALYPQQGTTVPPAEGTILLERSAWLALDIAVGDEVVVELLD